MSREAGIGGVDLAIFLATSGHSGVDRVFANLVPALAERVPRIDVLGIQGHGPTFAGLPSNVRQIRLPARHVGSALPALVAYLRRERPRVMLSDKDRVNRAVILASWLAGGHTRGVVRLGTTVSTNLASRGWLDRTVQSGSIRILYRHTHAVLVPSRGVAEDLERFARLPAALIRVVPNPVVRPDMDALAAEMPAHPWFSDGGSPVVLGVGELSSRKDFATLVRAHAQLLKAMDCRLMILGEGRQRAPLEALARELGTAERVALPGFVPNPYPYMARAAAFALTSRWEGLGIVLVEALALGTPAMACDCPSGPREVLDNGRYGPLVEVGNATAVASALKSLLLAPPARSLLLEAARPYTVEASVLAYLRAMNLGNRGTNHPKGA